MPTVEMGAQCWEGYPCPFMSYCKGKLSAKSVMNLTTLTPSKRKHLLLKKYKTLDDLPRNISLTTVQWAEVNALQKAGENYDKGKIKKFVNRITSSRLKCYIDIEAFMPAVPIYDSCKPYTNLCYQYSIVNSKGNLLKPMDRIIEPGSDPRRAFIESLLADTKDAAVIITYNKVPDIAGPPRHDEEKSYFETRLTELSDLYPDLQPQIKDRLDKTVDLSEPFAQKYYYHPLLKGSHSLKSIAALMAPDITFNRLQIANSEDARAGYVELPNLSQDAQFVRKLALKGFLKLSVIAMVRIAEKLELLAA